MRLRKLTVSGLFGLFNHEVSFNLAERITLVYAPNGYGKTVLLRLIAGFFGGSLRIFKDTAYSEVMIEFETNARVRIRRYLINQELDLGIRTQKEYGYEITYFDGIEERSYNPETWRASEGSKMPISVGTIERYVPSVRRVGVDAWHDITSGRTMTSNEVIHNYIEFLPRSVRSRIRLPEWLGEVRGSISCRLIDTERLYTKTTKARSQDFEGSVEESTPTIMAYSSQLSGVISTLLANSALKAQRLDQTFPNRILSRMRSDESPPTETELREKLFELIKKRERLASAGLLDSTVANEFISHDQFDDNTRRIFSIYVNDTEEKLSVYDALLAKLELLKSILNSRLRFKKVNFNKDRGFIFFDTNNQIIKPELLSSGEQHETVLAFDMLFNCKENTLVLIDEPEISLHIAWQKRFIPDLQRIIGLTGIDAVLCTHSPQLIGGYLDLAVELKAPDDVNVDVQ